MFIVIWFRASILFMPTSNVFDAIVVYNSSTALSASNRSKQIVAPFSEQSTHNKAYGYFLKTCLDYNLKAALTTSSDIIGPGEFKSYWTYTDKTWTKHVKQCKTNQIFTKFSPTTEEGKRLRKLLFSSPSIKPFDSFKIFELFFDKQKTFDTLSHHSIPTLTLTSSSIAGIKQTCSELSAMVDALPHKNDFTDSIIMKDRFGAGGQNIYKFKSSNTKSICETIDNNPSLSFVIQPFAKFDKGYTYNQITSATDIRLIYMNGQIVSCYLRMAKSGDFRCNQHQGGSVQYLTVDKIPNDIVSKANQIANILGKKSILYTLDFIISNNGNPYFLEGNTGPGLNWDQSDQVDKVEAKKLISLIVKELSYRVESSRSN